MTSFDEPQASPADAAGTGPTEVLSPGVSDGAPERESVDEPAKVMRIGSMVKQLLDEARQAPLDEASRVRLKEIYETSVQELGEAVSPDLKDELGRLALPFDAHNVPSESE